MGGFQCDPFFDTPAGRDLRHQILTNANHHCHYCGEQAHQIDRTDDPAFVPVCGPCFQIGRVTQGTAETKRPIILNKRRPNHPISIRKLVAKHPANVPGTKQGDEESTHYYPVLTAHRTL